MEAKRGKKLTIGILGSASGEQSLLLQKALRERGADAPILPPNRLHTWLPSGGTRAISTGGDEYDLQRLDGLVVRHLPGGSLEQVTYRLNVLHRLEGLGIRVINRPDAIEKMVDKYYTTSLLADAGLPVPETMVTERYAEAMEAVQLWGEALVKPVFGSMGRGIVKVDNPQIAHRVFRALEAGNYLYYLQRYITHGGVDYRLFIIGGEIIGAMARRGDGLCTNLALGAHAEPYQPPEHHARLALDTARLLGADYIGVDILESDGRAYVLEANGIPGWLGVQTVTERDIAGELAEYVLGVCHGRG